VDQKQTAWVNQLAAGLTRSELETTARVLGELRTRLEVPAATRRTRKETIMNPDQPS